MAYTNFIPQNVALPNTRRIGIYDSNGNRVGFIPLGSLTPPTPGRKKYSFGALSDVHIVYDTASDDFKRALTYLDNDADVAFTCICGDLTDNGSVTELQQYKAVVDAYAGSTPVYAVAGNHEATTEYNTTERIQPYTGQPLYYSFTHDDDVFVMVGEYRWNKDYLLSNEELQWLYETLETNRNKRCFVFFHVFPWGDSGNPNGIYTNNLFTGKPGSVFQSLMQHYKNVTLFHGHSHTKFYLQAKDPKANYSDALGFRSVHIPSLAVPRDDVNGDGTYENVYADSEGYVVDVYENGIHLRGRDFVKGEFLPIASYWLDTTLQTIPAGTYTDSTGTIKTGKYTNRVPLSTEADGVTIYNGGLGYKDGYRVRSGGAEGANGSAACTGFIKVNPGDIVRIAGGAFSDIDTANAINVCYSDFTNGGQLTPSYGDGGYGCMGSAWLDYSWKSVVEEKTGVWKWVVPPAISSIAYIRVSVKVNGHPENMIVTINEEIV